MTHDSVYSVSSLQQIDLRSICYHCTRDLPEAGSVCPYCGWDNRKRSEGFSQLPACTLKEGRYFIGRALGRGGFGITYIGRDLLAGQYENPIRAIKEFFPQGMAMREHDGRTVYPSAPEYMRSFDDGCKRAETEGKRIMDISKTVPHVVRAYDCVQENNTTYIVMEYIEGDTLTRIVQNQGAMPFKDLLTRLSPLLDSLDKMHSMSFYHMDISPDNIMMRKAEDGSYGEPVILDFGASFSLTTSNKTMTRTASVVRDGYSPPEQYNLDLTIQSLDLETTKHKMVRMDEYAIAATLYYALTGQVPQSHVALAVSGKKKQDPPSNFSKTIPAYVDEVILKAMSLKSEDRYQSVDDFQKALSHRPFPVKWVVIGAGAAAVCAGVLLLLNQPAKVSTQSLPNGIFTWSPSEQVQSAELVGTNSNGDEIRYQLNEVSEFPLSNVAGYTWELQETNWKGQMTKRSLIVEGE